MSNSILLVDDDQELCALLTDFLDLEGFSCVSVHDGGQALETLRDGRFDAVILDLMLPGVPGMEVLRGLRDFSQVPVLMLTARGEDTDRILGLEMGADDYLPKPCNPRELAARLRAILRRVKPTPGSGSELGVGLTRLNSANFSASYNGRELGLTSTEFGLLRTLLTHAGSVVPKETLSREALGRPLSAYDRSVDVHVSKIRRKLAAQGGDKLIVSVRGIGYQFSIDSQVAT